MLTRTFNENGQQLNPKVDAKMDRRCKRGRPRIRWEGIIAKDLEELGLDMSTSESLAMDAAHGGDLRRQGRHRSTLLDADDDDMHCTISSIVRLQCCDTVGWMTKGIWPVTNLAPAIFGGPGLNVQQSPKTDQ